MSDSVQPHRRQPTRLPCPWGSPGKNTGVGCHFLFQCRKVKSLRHVRLFETPWTAAYQAPPSMGYSRQEWWSGVPLPSPLICNICCSLGASLVAQQVKNLPAMQETQVRFLGWEDPLEKEMTIHSSTLAWNIPWTEEPDRLQSMGLQRVGHD